MGKRDRDRDLALLRKSVMRGLATGRDHVNLKVEAADGSHPLVFVLERELLNLAMLRVANAGGMANVFIGMDDGQVSLMFARPSVGALKAGYEDFGDVPKAITVGMFLSALSTTNEKRARATVDLPGDLGSVSIGDLVGAGSWS